VLDVPGLAPEHAERLASLVAEGLGNSPFQTDFAAERLRLDLRSSELGVEPLARLIVGELLRQMG
jgi:hypothetical protein